MKKLFPEGKIFNRKFKMFLSPIIDVILIRGITGANTLSKPREAFPPV
ncbi:MAG: hypothetical protein ACK4KT_08410 [Thermaurantimonas sp.]